MCAVACYITYGGFICGDTAAALDPVFALLCLERLYESFVELQISFMEDKTDMTKV